MAGLNVARAGYAAIALALAMAIATLLHLMRYRLQVPESDRVVRLLLPIPPSGGPAWR